jgi:cellulase/cellobiase CelA1
VVTDKIALYDTNLPMGEQLIWGVEPDPGTRLSELPPPDSITNPMDPVLGTFTTTIDLYNLWDTGHCAKFTVTNSGDSAAQPKAIQFILPAEVNITNSWNGTITRTGDTVDVALPDYLPVMEPGTGRTDFGYCADSSITPSLPSDEPVVSDPAPEPVAPNFSVSINVYDAWSTGYCSKFTVTNEGSVVAVPSGFTIVLPTSITITNSWNGAYVRNGDLMDVTLPGYIGEMQPGASRTDFGFCANGTIFPVIEGESTTATPEPATTTFSGTANLYSVWSTGYCARLNITNTGEVAQKPVTMQFTLPASITFSTSWGSTLNRDGDRVSVALPTWLADIPSGETIASGVGYCGNGTTPPSGFVVE